jgi:hypothetical protein
VCVARKCEDLRDGSRPTSCNSLPCGTTPPRGQFWIPGHLLTGRGCGHSLTEDAGAICAALPSSGLVLAGLPNQGSAATVGRYRHSAAARKKGLGTRKAVCAFAVEPDCLHVLQPGCYTQASASDLPLAGCPAFSTCMVAFPVSSLPRLQESDGPKRPLSSYMLFAKVRAGVLIWGARDCVDAWLQLLSR